MDWEAHKMKNVKGHAKWDTPPKKDDWNEKKERPDAGMILKRKAEAVTDHRPVWIFNQKPGQESSVSR
jgi:hypothetical protein